MIRVAKAVEPANFDELVRAPGLDAIREMLGQARLRKRPGKRRAKIAERAEDIPSSSFPTFWTEAIDDLLRSYNRICAYVSFFIEPVTGVPTVDHMVPRSRAWDKVYEWDNYRLCCHLVNSWKNDAEHFVDPFEIQDNWFELEFVGFEVKLGPEAPNHLREAIEVTLKVLNQRPCCELRKQYATDYSAGEISLSFLARRSPFVAREVRRQGHIRPQDR